MSNLEINLTHGDGDNKDAICHLLPCRIEYELDIKAREYFYPTIRELKPGGDHEDGRKVKHDELIDNTTSEHAKEPTLIASFRGKPLQGKCIKLPEGYRGHVINKQVGSTSSKMSTSSKSTKQIQKQFSEFTYWNWDELPSKSDTVVKSLSWIKIANALHSPIE